MVHPCCFFFCCGMVEQQHSQQLLEVEIGTEKDKKNFFFSSFTVIKNRWFLKILPAQPIHSSLPSPCQSPHFLWCDRRMRSPEITMAGRPRWTWVPSSTKDGSILCNDRGIMPYLMGYEWDLICLVVWNMFYLLIQLGMKIPTDFHICFYLIFSLERKRTLSNQR